MSLQDGMAVEQVMLKRIAGSDLFDRTFRVCEPGDHIEIGGKWAVVRRVSGGKMTVEYLGRREDPGKQNFPEYDALRRAEESRQRHIERGSQPLAGPDPIVVERKLSSPVGGGWR